MIGTLRMESSDSEFETTYAATLRFAQSWHGDQLRKYTNEPYLAHLRQVGRILLAIHASTDVVKAGILHDILEDTQATLAILEEEFGSKVASLVLEVSDKSVLSDGNRATRKEIDRRHLAKASIEGKTIKLADVISNTPDIVKLDPKFAMVYLSEIEGLLNVLADGNQELVSRAYKLLEQEKTILHRL